MSDVPRNSLMSVYMHLFGRIYAQWQALAPRGFHESARGAGHWTRRARSDQLYCSDGPSGVR